MSEQLQTHVALKLAQRCWCWPSLALRFFSVSWSLTWLDGLVWLRYPFFSLLMPMGLCALGLLVGFTSLGYEMVFSESLTLLMVAAFVGTLSARFGASLLIGFVVGDLARRYTILKTLFDAFTKPDTSVASALVDVSRQVFPLAIQYGLLSWLLLTTSQLTKQLLTQPWLLRIRAKSLRTAILIVLYVIVNVGLVFLWINAVPVLIRPMFTWQGSSPPVNAMSALQTQSIYILTLVAMASALRISLQVMAASRESWSVYLKPVEDRINQQLSATFNGSVIKEWLIIPLRAAWSTLLLAGMYSSWFDAIAMTGLIITLQVVRLLRVPMLPPKLARLPLLLRWIVAMTLSYTISQWFLAHSWGESFRPFLLMTAVTLIIFHVLTPSSRAMQRQEHAS